MHWNDKLFTGKQDSWHWGVAISNEANPYPLLLNAFPQKLLVDYPNKSKAHVIRANFSPYADEHDGYEGLSSISHHAFHPPSNHSLVTAVLTWQITPN